MGWRLDPDSYKATWDSGIGAAKGGGRWNSKGTHAVYCSLDPATAILEVAVHVGFDDLDSIPRVLTSLKVLPPINIRVVTPGDAPNPNWLRPGRPSARQQMFGDALLAGSDVFVIPSAVSPHSWNLVFLAGTPHVNYIFQAQERFALDTRLAS